MVAWEWLECRGSIKICLRHSCLLLDINIKVRKEEFKSTFVCRGSRWLTIDCTSIDCTSLLFRSTYCPMIPMCLEKSFSLLTCIVFEIIMLIQTILWKSQWQREGTHDNPTVIHYDWSILLQKLCSNLMMEITPLPKHRQTYVLCLKT